MRGKCGKALLYTLFITYIRIDFSKNSELGLIKSRYMKPCLSHKGNKSHCLKRNCLTSSVRSCYHQKLKVFAQINIYWYNLFLIYQRMSALLYIYPPIKVKYRLCCTHLLCQFCLCKNKVKFRKHSHIISKLIQIACCLI